MPDAFDLRLRPVRAADRPFLLRVYAGTREEELRPVPWDQAQKDAFVRQQFEAQDAYYRAHLPDVSYDVVVVDGEDVGRLYLARWAAELHVVDIALLPEHRGRGIGERLLLDVIAEATNRDLKVSIDVERFNVARSLYRRLGFVEVDEGDVYILMELDPRRS